MADWMTYFQMSAVEFSIDDSGNVMIHACGGDRFLAADDFQDMVLEYKAAVFEKNIPIFLADLASLPKGEMHSKSLDGLLNYMNRRREHAMVLGQPDNASVCMLAEYNTTILMHLSSVDSNTNLSFHRLFIRDQRRGTWREE